MLKQLSEILCRMWKSFVENIVCKIAKLLVLDKFTATQHQLQPCSVYNVNCQNTFIA